MSRSSLSFLFQFYWLCYNLALFLIISLPSMAVYGSMAVAGCGVALYAVNIFIMLISLSILSLFCRLAICSALFSNIIKDSTSPFACECNRVIL